MPAEQYVVEVDSSDPPLPRLIGPFASRRAATTWMAEQPLTAAEWNVAPLTAAEPTVIALPPEPPAGTEIELLNGKDKGLRLIRVEREPSAGEYHWREQYHGTCWRWDEVLRWGVRVVGGG